MTRLSCLGRGRLGSKAGKTDLHPAEFCLYCTTVLTLQMSSHWLGLLPGWYRQELSLPRSKYWLLQVSPQLLCHNQIHSGQALHIPLQSMWSETRTGNSQEVTNNGREANVHLGLFLHGGTTGSGEISRHGAVMALGNGRVQSVCSCYSYSFHGVCVDPRGCFSLTSCSRIFLVMSCP